MAKDIIYRQDTIDAMCELMNSWFGNPKDEQEEITRVVNHLPSAQPEIIRCRDCKWKQGAECVRFADVRPFADDFCSRAERREE